LRGKMRPARASIRWRQLVSACSRNGAEPGGDAGAGLTNEARRVGDELLCS
jgi:hypothetical protein